MMPVSRKRNVILTLPEHLKRGFSWWQVAVLLLVAPMVASSPDHDVPLYQGVGLDVHGTERQALVQHEANTTADARGTGHLVQLHRTHEPSLRLSIQGHACRTV